MADKKKKSAPRPEVPNVDLTAPTEAPAPKYEPMSVEDFIKFMNAGYDVQLARAPQVAEMQRQQAGPFAATAWQLAHAYSPKFHKTYKALGRRIQEGLAAGYELGPGLSREVQQAIRGAQTARGNILGAAPTAQEAFGEGQAALNLYNTRLGQAQGFLQGRQPLDLASQAMSSFISPSQAYVNQGLGAQAAIASGQQGQDYNQTVMSGYNTFQNALQNYNQNQLTGQFGTYDRQAESWMYDEAIRRGLYSTPSVGGGGMGGGMGGMMSGLMGGVGTGLASGIGIAAAGGSATAAIGGGVAAAASAAGAAICWLARRCIPDHWEQFQRYLFTDAPEKLRRLYLYNARRLAREISDDEAIEIGELMDDCLNLRSLP